MNRSVIEIAKIGQGQFTNLRKNGVTTSRYKRGIVLLQRCHDLTNGLKMIQCR